MVVCSADGSSGSGLPSTRREGTRPGAGVVVGEGGTRVEDTGVGVVVGEVGNTGVDTGAGVVVAVGTTGRKDGDGIVEARNVGLGPVEGTGIDTAGSCEADFSLSTTK